MIEIEDKNKNIALIHKGSFDIGKKIFCINTTPGGCVLVCSSKNS